MEFIDQIFSQTENALSIIWVQMLSLVLFATFHGYGAAWLAVRMLFRPRKPVKLLGITIFPQGMIPRHRERLANAIGKAVGEELVSQETIMDELLEKDFLRRKIGSIVNSYTASLLSENYPSFVEALPATLREPVLDSITTLQFKISEHIDEILKNEDTKKGIKKFVENKIDYMLSKRVSEVIDDETFFKIADFAEERIHSALKAKVLEQKIREFVGSRIDSLLNSEIPLGDFLTAESISLIKAKANEQIEPMAHHLTELAAAERTRNQIGALIKKEVHEYYENLPFFKKIFVSRDNLIGEVDDLVNESLPKRIEDMLKGDVFAAEASELLNNGIEKALSRPVPELIGSIDPTQLQNLKDQITDSIIKLLRNDDMRSQIRNYLIETIEKFRPHSIDSILRNMHPGAENDLKQTLSAGILNIISRPGTSRAVNEMIAGMLDSLMSVPIGKISDHISEDKINQAGDTITDTVILSLREKLPEAIKEFDVGGVVREKVMNYPVEKLEKLILSVAGEHLRTIELIGALLGFVLGVGQAALHYYYFSQR